MRIWGTISSPLIRCIEMSLRMSSNPCIEINARASSAESTAIHRYDLLRNSRSTCLISGSSSTTKIRALLTISGMAGFPFSQLVRFPLRSASLGQTNRANSSEPRHRNNGASRHTCRIQFVRSPATVLRSLICGVRIGGRGHSTAARFRSMPSSAPLKVCLPRRTTGPMNGRALSGWEIFLRFILI